MHGRRNYRLAANSSPWFLLSRTTVMGLRGDDGEDCRRHSNTEKLGRITQQYEYAGPRTVELADCCSCRPRNWLCSSQTTQTESYMHGRRNYRLAANLPPWFPLSRRQQSWDSAETTEQSLLIVHVVEHACVAACGQQPCRAGARLGHLVLGRPGEPRGRRTCSST